MARARKVVVHALATAKCAVRSAKCELHARVATTLSWLSSLSAVLSAALCVRGVRLKKRDKSAMQHATRNTRKKNCELRSDALLVFGAR